MGAYVDTPNPGPRGRLAAGWRLADLVQHSRPHIATHGGAEAPGRQAGLAARGSALLRRQLRPHLDIRVCVRAQQQQRRPGPRAARPQEPRGVMQGGLASRVLQAGEARATEARRGGVCVRVGSRVASQCIGSAWVGRCWGRWWCKGHAGGGGGWEGGGCAGAGKECASRARLQSHYPSLALPPPPRKAPLLPPRHPPPPPSSHRPPQPPPGPPHLAVHVR